MTEEYNKEVSSFNNPITAKHWFLNLGLMSLTGLTLPTSIVMTIVMIVWATGNGGASEAKKGYMIASLLMSLTIIVILTIVLYVIASFAYTPIY